MNQKNFRLRGPLAARALKNYARLEDPIFSPDTVFGDKTHNNGWPGDRDGRVMLALTLHERLTGRESAYLAEFLRRLPGEMNELGYRGEPIGQIVPEQTLAGHSWLLRALLERYDHVRDEHARSMAERIVENLYLPLAGRFARYPADPASRHRVELVAGAHDGAVADGWRTSSDVGCAFIALDGLSHYYELFRDPRVLSLLEEMIAAYSAIDFMALSMQTHATLTALRGVSRLYRAEGKPEYLQLTRDIFDMYLTRGMSENYENHNWFARPHWTEPCAVVDSYILSMDLLRYTGEARYADTANRILYSGLLRGQRANGGFGCDSCLGYGEEPDILRDFNDEAYWCCTMRGAEGFARVADSAAILEGGQCRLPHLIAGVYEPPSLRLEIETDYPFGDTARIEISNDGSARTLLFDLPDGAYYTLDGAAWDPGASELPRGEHVLDITIPMGLARRAAPGGHTIWHGPLLLGSPDAETDTRDWAPAGPARYASPGGKRLFPVLEAMYAPECRSMRAIFPGPREVAP